MTPKQAAEIKLEEAGCTREKKEDHQGTTKSGWWQDTVFLSNNPIEAWKLLNGN
jgi:hypothetical protein